MRYIWSEIDSPATMLKRLHPSRLVVFSCSRRWKKGTGEVGFEGTGVGRADRAGRRKQGFTRAHSWVLYGLREC